MGVKIIKKPIKKKPIKKSISKNLIKTTHNKKRLILAMEQSYGIVTQACNIVGLSRKTYYTYYETDEAFAKEIDAIENLALDFVEGQLHKNIKEGKEVSTLFYLKCKGKKRGYIEKQHIEHSGEIDSKIIYTKEDAFNEIESMQQEIKNNEKKAIGNPKANKVKK